MVFYLWTSPVTSAWRHLFFVDRHKLSIFFLVQRFAAGCFQKKIIRPDASTTYISRTCLACCFASRETLGSKKNGSQQFTAVACLVATMAERGCYLYCSIVPFSFLRKWVWTIQWVKNCTVIGNDLPPLWLSSSAASAWRHESCSYM